MGSWGHGPFQDSEWVALLGGYKQSAGGVITQFEDAITKGGAYTAVAAICDSLGESKYNCMDPLINWTKAVEDKNILASLFDADWMMLSLATVSVEDRAKLLKAALSELQNEISTRFMGSELRAHMNQVLDVGISTLDKVGTQWLKPLVIHSSELRAFKKAHDDSRAQCLMGALVKITDIHKKGGKTVGYTIVDVRGKTMQLDAKQLKESIKRREMTAVGYKLTVDNKLIKMKSR